MVVAEPPVMVVTDEVDEVWFVIWFGASVALPENPSVASMQRLPCPTSHTFRGIGAHTSGYCRTADGAAELLETADEPR